MAVTYDAERNIRNCHVCKLVVNGNFKECWGCTKIVHNECIKRREKVLPRGPWHCTNCYSFHKKRCTRDITLDQELLRYVVLGELPDTMAAKSRVTRHAQYIKIDANGGLWLTGDRTSPKKVPPMRDRTHIMEEAFK